MLGQESSVSSTSSKRKGPMAPTRGFGVHPDSEERGQERERLLKTVKEITKVKGDITPMQNFRG